METEVKKKCFVIMPFTETSPKHTEEYWTNHYMAFLKPLIETGRQLIAECSRPLREDILRQIITKLVTVPIVVADLTDANPNVYWELGVRQSFKHGTIAIAEDGTELPFDVSVKATLFYYPTDHLRMEGFKTQFNEAIDDCLENPNFPDSHVLETISGRGTLYQILIRDEAIRRLEAILSEIKRNEHVIKLVMDTCNANVKQVKEAKTTKKEVIRSFVVSRFSTSAVEMLVVSRYIDADNDFYVTAEEYMDTLIRFNEELPRWADTPEQTEKYLLKVEQHIKSIMSKFKKLVSENKKLIEVTL